VDKLITAGFRPSIAMPATSVVYTIALAFLARAQAHGRKIDVTN
jgi:hypothetical protein